MDNKETTELEMMAAQIIEPISMRALNIPCCRTVDEAIERVIARERATARLRRLEYRMYLVIDGPFVAIMAIDAGTRLDFDGAFIVAMGHLDPEERFGAALYVDEREGYPLHDPRRRPHEPLRPSSRA